MKRFNLNKLQLAIRGIVTLSEEVSEHFDDAGQPLSIAAMDDAQLIAEVVARVHLPNFSVAIPIAHPRAKVLFCLEAEHNSSGYVAADLNIVINHIAYTDAVDPDHLNDPVWAGAMHEIWTRVITGDTTPIAGSAFVDMLRTRVDHLVAEIDRAGYLKGAA